MSNQIKTCFALSLFMICSSTFAQTAQPKWESAGMNDSDTFSVNLNQGNGVTVRTSITCTSTAVDQVWFELSGIGSRTPADLIPANVHYFSDAGRNEFTMKAFLSANRIALASNNASINRQIVSDMLHSSTLDFDFTIYNVNWGKGLYVVPTKHLPQLMSKYPFCSKLFGLKSVAEPVTAPPKTGQAAPNLGNQGTGGPADAKHPLIHSNRSLMDSVWCKQQACRLISKVVGEVFMFEDHLIEYTYSTKVGQVKVWRIGATGYTTRSQLIPKSVKWNIADVQGYYAIMTGRQLPIKVASQCVNSKKTTDEIHSDVIFGKSKQDIDLYGFGVNCQIVPKQPNALDIKAYLMM